MIEIMIGDCGCCWHPWGPNPYAYTCRKTRVVYLGIGMTERNIERSINHESIHSVLLKRVGRRAAIGFDNTFKHGFNSVGANGVPNEQRT